MSIEVPDGGHVTGMRQGEGKATHHLPGARQAVPDQHQRAHGGINPFREEKSHGRQGSLDSDFPQPLLGRSQIPNCCEKKK
jgi:hypothetical protein